jgi:uncharacterized membrane protein YedE/YeeE
MSTTTAYSSSNPAAPSRRAAGPALAALASGTLFGLGLGIAQMIDPLKVLAFLDLAGDWDPSLVAVLGAAVAVAAAGYAALRRRTRPLLASAFSQSGGAGVDAPLVAGSALFGIGWGLAGYCPGPAIASIGFGNAEALWFVPAMVLGTGVGRWQAKSRKARRSSDDPA